MEDFDAILNDELDGLEAINEALGLNDEPMTDEDVENIYGQFKALDAHLFGSDDA